MEVKKRTRRSEDQLLTDTITALYEKIQKKITQIEDEKAVVEEVFDALRPLRELEDSYRRESSPIPRVYSDESMRLKYEGK